MLKWIIFIIFAMILKLFHYLLTDDIAAEADNSTAQQLVNSLQVLEVTMSSFHPKLHAQVYITYVFSLHPSWCIRPHVYTLSCLISASINLLKHIVSFISQQIVMG